MRDIDLDFTPSRPPHGSTETGLAHMEAASRLTVKQLREDIRKAAEGLTWVSGFDVHGDERTTVTPDDELGVEF